MIRYADTRQPLHGQHYTEAEIKEIAVLQNSVLEIVPEPKKALAWCANCGEQMNQGSLTCPDCGMIHNCSKCLMTHHLFNCDGVSD